MITFTDLIHIANKHLLTVNTYGSKNNYKVELIWIGYPSHMLDHGIVYSVCGIGNTLDEAAHDFYTKANGKTLVFSPYELNRHEVKLHI
jgi:hypothetical protein